MSPIKCKSCGNRFDGNYCNNCGEKVIKPEDRTLKHFLGQFFNALTFANGKFLNTIKTIIIKPGVYSSDYVEGRRVPYMKPISIFFLVNLIYFLFPLVNTFNTSLYLQQNAFPYSPRIDSLVKEEVKNRTISYEEYEVLYNNKTTELSKMLLIVFVILLSIWYSIIHIGSIRKLYADHLVVSFEVMTFVLFITVQFIGLLAYLGRLIGLDFIGSNFYITTSAVILLVYFKYFVERNFYRFGAIRAIFNMMFSLLGLAIALFSYRLILFYVTFWSI